MRNIIVVCALVFVAFAFYVAHRTHKNVLDVTPRDMASASPSVRVIIR